MSGKVIMFYEKLKKEIDLVRRSPCFSLFSWKNSYPSPINGFYGKQKLIEDLTKSRIPFSISHQFSSIFSNFPTFSSNDSKLRAFSMEKK